MHGQVARVDRLVVVVQRLVVLRVGVAELADRADAEGDEVAVGVRRIALEIPVQRALAQRDRQLVAGQRKVVHADVDVARRGQLFHGQAQQRELLGAARQVLGVDALLRLEHVRQVRVAVHGQAVGLRVDDDVERALEALAVLLRQAVDQVHAHRLVARGAGPVHQREGLLRRLHAIHRDLHLRIEVLDAQAHAVDAGARQQVDRVRLAGSRVDLDRELPPAVLAQVEVPVELLEQVLELPGIQEGGRAATEMQLVDDTLAIEQFGLQLDLPVEAREIILGLLAAARDDLGAAAVEARAGAERHMHVERQRRRRRRAIGGGRRGAILGLAETVVELDGRRVGRVARAGPVVAADEVGVESDRGFHVDHHCSWVLFRGLS